MSTTMSGTPPDQDGGWIQTFTLRKVHPLRPKPEMIHLLDIAHALSMQCRYTGHIHSFYSVAQHCVLVSKLAERMTYARTRSVLAALEAARSGLLHDASEAYLVDLARPVKHLPEMAAYRQAEATLQALIFRVFGLPDLEPQAVKEADRILGATEARDFFPAVHPDWVWIAEPLAERLEAVGPKEAEALFLRRFEELGPWPREGSTHVE
jgi:5'-deoxynucleotidase YfbR-like HD superfamily hydrolase